ncbi:MAG: flippase-like domain-containing protein, partial [Alphaproteobacteria bacterium]|nr:flippase-like domain-containing protein [Alphaproteobacteria bacterium]
GNGGAGWWVWLALGISVGMVLGLWVIQHPRVLGWVERLTVRLASDFTGIAWLGAEGLRAALDVVYGRWRRVGGALVLHLMAWVVGVGESWLALAMMGRPLSFVTVLALEAVVFAVRNAAFAVPWAAGVQEGGYLAIGAVLGLTPETALTLSLVRRVPDLMLGLPGLLWWQIRERAAAGGRVAAKSSS